MRQNINSIYSGHTALLDEKRVMHTLDSVDMNRNALWVWVLRTYTEIDTNIMHNSPKVHSRRGLRQTGAETSLHHGVPDVSHEIKRVQAEELHKSVHSRTVCLDGHTVDRVVKAISFHYWVKYRTFGRKGFPMKPFPCLCGAYDTFFLTLDVYTVYSSPSIKDLSRDMFVSTNQSGHALSKLGKRINSRRLEGKLGRRYSTLAYGVVGSLWEG